ncbi:helicase HerA-like domain-containing protein [Microbulbifer sp. SA54]|uniref:helicase HerA-like domain-containing protein n=1 Tax=Microbulbifer sp. SA54 TaxID=3401577 RepID=UPI003AAEB980
MDPIPVGLAPDSGQATVQLLPQMLSRHGLICGATGTGKTVTLRYLVEQLNQRGIATFVTDLKGDLTGLAAAGGNSAKVSERLARFGLDTTYYHPCPVSLWGPDALPLRTTPSELGPELLGQMLSLNDNQQGLMQLLFHIADQLGLFLLDWKDLLALINFAETYRKSLQPDFGTISPASLGAIKRKLLALESLGADALFGEPALDLSDLVRGQQIHLLDAHNMQPHLYGILLLWILAELYENLPESGDSALKLVLFFDEAHLLFDDLPKALRDQVEQIVKLIRSRGVGVFFITQNPMDIPEGILAQLGNRIQHALRAYTPSEQQAVKAAAKSFRANPNLDTATAITQLAVGEALVSCLDREGVPATVERVLIHPPASRLTPLDDSERRQLLQEDPLARKYAQSVDRESAFEQLRQRRAHLEEQAGSTPDRPRKSARTASTLEKSLGRAASSFGRQIGRELVRGLLGALSGGRR